jgi:hypothetical protein
MIIRSEQSFNAFKEGEVVPFTDMLHGTCDIVISG